MYQTEDILSKAVFAVLLITTFLTPIFFVPFSFISSQFAATLLFACGTIPSIIFFVISSLRNKTINLVSPTKYFLALVVLIPLTYFLSGATKGLSHKYFFGDTLDIYTVGFTVLLFVYLFLVSIYFTDKKKIFYSYFTFLAAAVLLGTFIFLRMFIGPNFLSFGIFNLITQTPIGSWNNTGVFFGACLVLSFITFELAPVSKLMKMFLGIASFFSGFILITSNFGGSWFAVGATSIMFIGLNFFNNEHYLPISFYRKIKKTPVLPLIIFATSVFFLLWGSSLGIKISSIFNIKNVEIRPSLSATYSITENVISNSPLFGSGPNTFVNDWLLWKPDDVSTTIFWNTDFSGGVGLIPTYLATTGLLGMLSWIVFFIVYVLVGIKSVLKWREDKFLMYLNVSSFFTSLYLWIMAVAYVPTVPIYVLTLFFTGLFFASANISGALKTKQVLIIARSKTGFLKVLLLIIIGTLSVLLGLRLYKETVSLWYFQKSSQALNMQKDNDLSKQYMLKAIKYVPSDVYFRALVEIELDKLNFAVSQDINKIAPSIIQKQFSEVLANAIRAGTLARDSDPSNYLNWMSLGRVYDSVSSPELKVKNAYSNAITFYNKALELNPKNPAIFVALSRIEMSQKNIDKAREYARGAIQAKNNYLDAFFVLSQIEVSSGNIKAAADALSASVALDPTNPATFFQLGLLKYNQSEWNGAIEAFQRAIGLANDYANAKYFLGLSYEITGQHDKAIKEFQDLKVTNPESKEVGVILSNLLAGKPIFTNTESKKPEKGKSLPIQQR